MLKYNCQKLKIKKVRFVEIFTNLELFRNAEPIAKTLRYYLQLFMEDITMYITSEDPAPIYSKYDDEFTFENGIHLKPTASNYAIKAYLLQEAIYKRVKGDNQIINYMIKEFKN